MPSTAPERAIPPTDSEPAGRAGATASLLASLQDGRTGCLSAAVPGVGAVQAFLMAGDVLAVHAGDDDIRLLARVSAANLVPGAELEALAESCPNPGEFTDALYGVLDESTVQGLLFERFRENLYCFLGATDVAPFEPMEALFVANIQVGHDSHALVEELRSLRHRVGPLLSARLLLLPADGTATTAMEAEVIEACSNGLGVPELLRRASAEPNRVLQLVSDLLDRGALAWDNPPPVKPTTPPPTAPAASEPSALDLPLEDDYTDDGTQRSAPPSAPPVVEEEYLDAFGDYDTTRGDGSFSGVRDRIDLAAADPDDELPGGRQASEPEMIDMPEADAAAQASAVSLNFSGPRLADDDARHKVDVVNEVLEAVRAAIDYLKGAGSGHARVQLIVDGSAGPFSALFNGVELRADGRLPVDAVLKNLRKRPITEHRRLLQRACTDVIERALSLASEDLDDVLMEQVLEKVAGYQQRLGI